MKQANEQTKFRTSIGGQALIEGILMRGPRKQAIVVRDPQGELVVKEALDVRRKLCACFGNVKR